MLAEEGFNLLTCNKNYSQGQMTQIWQGVHVLPLKCVKVNSIDWSLHRKQGQFIDFPAHDTYRRENSNGCWYWVLWMCPNRSFRESDGSLVVMEVKHPCQSMVVEPCGLALVGVPLIALKMPIESDRVLLVPSSTGFIIQSAHAWCLTAPWPGLCSWPSSHHGTLAGPL